MTLFIGNLTEEWQDVDRLEKDLGQHGQVERAFIAYNAQGESKVLLSRHYVAVLRLLVWQDYRWLHCGSSLLWSEWSDL